MGQTASHSNATAAEGLKNSDFSTHELVGTEQAGKRNIALEVLSISDILTDVVKHLTRHDALKVRYSAQRWEARQQAKARR